MANTFVAAVRKPKDVEVVGVMLLKRLKYPQGGVEYSTKTSPRLDHCYYLTKSCFSFVGMLNVN